MLVFMQSMRYSCQISTKLAFSGQIFEKLSNIKFRENPSVGSRWRDRHENVSGLFLQFCERP